MIPLALDNGEPNLTMANQLVQKKFTIEGYFCTQMVPSSCETKWCSITLCLFALVLYIHSQQQIIPNRKGHLYRFKHVLLL